MSRNLLRLLWNLGVIWNQEENWSDHSFIKSGSNRLLLREGYTLAKKKVSTHSTNTTELMSLNLLTLFGFIGSYWELLGV